MGRDGKASSREIYGFLCERTKMTPTRNQLSNILCKSGFFEAVGKIRMTNIMGHSSTVTVWGVKAEKAEAEGFLEPIPDEGN